MSQNILWNFFLCPTPPKGFLLNNFDLKEFLWVAKLWQGLFFEGRDGLLTEDPSAKPM